jgi:hypothetical protein
MGLSCPVAQSMPPPGGAPPTRTVDLSAFARCRLALMPKVVRCPDPWLCGVVNPYA